MRWCNAGRIGVTAAIALLLAFVCSAQQYAQAQNRVTPPPMEWQWSGDPALPYLQRSLEIYEFKKAAQSGPERGREIFYYKCWMCHQDLSTTAPHLNGLFQRSMMVTGKPVTEDNVRNQILNGSADMAAYKNTLSEADVNDLVSFLRTECCWNSDAPPLNPRYIASKATSAPPLGQPLGASRNVTLGGPKGLVKSSKGDLLEGMMVQLVSKKSAIRTTVFSDADGRYEFPKLDAGDYTLRIARPLEYFPFIKDNVHIDGATQFDDIVLARMSNTELLPPLHNVAAQMTGSEWLLSLSGTGEQKALLTNYCNFCHTYQQIFRNRYDEQSWGKIVYRMTRGAGSPLINIREPGRLTKEDEANLVHWLATVRGPDSKDPPFVEQSRPHGRATKVVITEYELPRLETATHDVTGDNQGGIWYSTHRSSYVGRLDPNTGAVREFHVPPPDARFLPGTHWITVDKGGIVWGSENWAHNIWRLDPKTMDFKRVPWKVSEPPNSPMGGNYALDPDGGIWRSREKAVSKIGALSGEIVENLPTKKFSGTYGSAVSADGRYFGGGAWPKDGVVVADIKSGQIFEPETSPNSGPARGDFDLQDNYWSAGRAGILVEYNIAEKKIHEYRLPTPYASLYQVKPDKNGEVWAGEMHTGHYARFDPKTQTFVEYELPEPYGMDRKTWIDNSTSPVTVWYVDQEGYISRIQPLD